MVDGSSHCRFRFAIDKRYNSEYNMWYVSREHLLFLSYNKEKVVSLEYTGVGGFIGIRVFLTPSLTSCSHYLQKSNQLHILSCTLLRLLVFSVRKFAGCDEYTFPPQ